MERRHRLSSIAVNLGFVSNVGLAAVKTLVGILGHSTALLADGINSTSDVAYYVVVLVFMRLSRKPADREHPYGHSQFESIAALVVGSFVITTAVAIFWDSINKAYDFYMGNTNPAGAALLALWVALFTVGVKLGLTLVTRLLARKSQNPVVTALAQDHRNDIFSAGGVAIGIYLARTGYPWLDPLAGAVVAIVILVTGIQILRESSVELMDTMPGEVLNRQIRELLLSVPGVREVEEIRAHRFGPYMVVNVTIGIDGMLSVAEGDQIASGVEHRLTGQVAYVMRAYVHYHPAGRSHATESS